MNDDIHGRRVEISVLVLAARANEFLYKTYSFFFSQHKRKVLV